MAELLDTAEMVRDISVHIDEANAHRDPEARTWGRLAKVAEEAGEVIDAWIGYTGQNPRKGQYAGRDDVVEELLDTALTALAAVEHMTGNRGQSMTHLVSFVAGRAERLGLPELAKAANDG